MIWEKSADEVGPGQVGKGLARAVEAHEDCPLTVEHAAGFSPKRSCGHICILMALWCQVGEGTEVGAAEEPLLGGRSRWGLRGDPGNGLFAGAPPAAGPRPSSFSLPLHQGE